MTKPVISDFEAGVMVALGALKIAAMQTPGFNIDALEQAAETLRKNMQGVKDQAAFDLPISCVATRHDAVVELMKARTN
jgi:hypothetical protein